MLKSYKDLIAWRKSFELSKQIYKSTKKFPKEETYGLTAQIRRSAISIPSNIAEGYGRQAIKEYIHSLYIAYGSLCELETQLLLSNEFDYISHSDFNLLRSLVGDTDRLLMALIKSLENKV